MPDAAFQRMDTLNRWLVTHAHHVRLGWLVLLGVLAACNNGDSGGSGY